MSCGVGISVVSVREVVLIPHQQLNVATTIWSLPHSVGVDSRSLVSVISLVSEVSFVSEMSFIFGMVGIFGTIDGHEGLYSVCRRPRGPVS